ncbi:MAG: HAMP domain-containing protein [Deltaproteobacteria bacterium]|nr:HAMP domain-containing protein [Deltaproteobacteria bacterium]
MFRSLRSQLIAIVVGTVAFVLAVSQGLNTHLSEDALEQDARARALLVLREVGLRWGRADRATLQSDLDAIVQGDRDIVGIELLRFDGDLVQAETEASEIGAKAAAPLSPDEVAALRHGQTTTAVVPAAAGDNHLIIAVPLQQYGQIRGAARVELRSQAMHRLKSRLRTIDTAMLLASTLVISLALSLFLQRRVGKPVAALVAAMRQAEAGALAARVTVQGSGEFGFLTYSFNRMLGRIQELTAHLEERVRSATRGLEDKNRELREANERLWRAQLEISRSERLATLGQMAGTLAHELGTPLNSVLGYVQLLAGQELNQEHAEKLGIIESQVRRMVDTIRSVLDRTRDAPLARSPVAFASLIADTLTLLESRFAARGVTVRVDVPTTLPLVHGDAIGLRQVFVNLLTNALDALEGVGQIDIVARALPRTEQRGLQVALSVHDSGRGMTADELRHAFEPFYTTKAPGRGTGLGLMIVEQIVHAHGGQLKAESSPGHGTTIRIYLPAEES